MRGGIGNDTRADPRMLQTRIKTVGLWRLVIALAFALPGTLLVSGVGMSGVAFAQSGAIREISVAGNRRVEPETVRSYLEFTVGDAYDAGAVDRSLKALFATGLFSDVRIDRNGSTVVVTVVENPVINQVAFEGNSEVDSDTLKNEVQLKPRSVYTRARVQSDVQRILDVYRRQGRFAASVEPKIIELEQDRVNLVFEITEGTATKVKAINFVGNHAFSDQQLRDIVSTTQSGWFDFLKGTSIYDPDRMNLDRELLRQYYLKNGYADARVISANAELDLDGTGFIITYTVEEGELFDFGSVTIESSLPGVEPAKYQGELLTKAGEVYNASLIDKSVERLTLAISEEGFTFSRVRPRATPDLASHTISLVYAVDEGPRIYIDRINIIGNTRTKDYVIRREFRLAEGDAYNPMLVDRAKKRLQGLGLFKSVDVKRRPGSSPDRVVLDVELEEQSTGELSFGAGYSTSEGVIGDVSITERNLLGNGQFLRLRLAGSMERFQIDLSFTEPRFLDRNMSAGFDLFHKEINQRYESGFSSRKTGASFRIGYPLAENLWVQNSYTISRDQIFDVRDEASLAIKQACGWGPTINTPSGNGGHCEGDPYWTSALGTTVTYDKRNHPTNPTSGYFFQTAGDFAGVGGDVQYVRLSAEARGYYPIADGITLVGRAIGGHIEGWGGDSPRLLDLYFKGGETIRGFDRAGIGPRDLSANDPDRSAIGGTTYWATTAEVRFPIPFLPDDLGISGALFADAGSVFGVTDETKALGIDIADDSSVRASLGGSILWNSPVGPLRMDFAKAILKESYDQTQFFRFGASTKF
jgi:outer membrane protein insertion porin family